MTTATARSRGPMQSSMLHGPPAKVYISGKMTGIARDNAPAFKRAAKVWRAAGHYVMNPAENFGGGPSYPPRHICMEHDIHQVLFADVIAVLQGWHESKGARAEVLLAQELNKHVVHATTGLPVDGVVITSATPRDARRVQPRSTQTTQPTA